MGSRSNLLSTQADDRKSQFPRRTLHPKALAKSQHGSSLKQSLQSEAQGGLKACTCTSALLHSLPGPRRVGPAGGTSAVDDASLGLRDSDFC